MLSPFLKKYKKTASTHILMFEALVSYFPKTSSTQCPLITRLCPFVIQKYFFTSAIN